MPCILGIFRRLGIRRIRSTRSSLLYYASPSSDKTPGPRLGVSSRLSFEISCRPGPRMQLYAGPGLLGFSRAWAFPDVFATWSEALPVADAASVQRGVRQGAVKYCKVVQHITHKHNFAKLNLNS